MWVRLTRIAHLDLDGRQRKYHPGDWVEIGKQDAHRMIADGAAELAEGARLGILDHVDAGILSTGPIPRSLIARLGAVGLPEVPIRLREGAASAPWGPPASLPWEYTLLLDPALPLRLELLVAGFRFLERWSGCAPLYSYTELAATVLPETEREATRTLLHDLRVPLYETGAVFLRRGDDSARVLAAWQQELTGSGGGASPGGSKASAMGAFLRALYQTRPIWLALPVTWIAGRER